MSVTDGIMKDEDDELRKHKQSEGLLRTLVTFGFMLWAIVLTFMYANEKSSAENCEKDLSLMSAPEVDHLAVREALRKFLNSLDDDPTVMDPTRYERAYHPNPGDQSKDYHFCTIVQECLDPEFMLSIGEMTGEQRGLAYDALSKAMSPGSFNMLQLQQHSNMILGEMQDWADQCPGTCRELRDPDGLLPYSGEDFDTFDEFSMSVGALTREECFEKYEYGVQPNKKIFWYCDDEPRMIHHANIDPETGRYYMGNVWEQPHEHGRNSWYDYFSVYGDLSDTGNFGLRFSGHHIDINYRWNGMGELVQDTPVFLGHNPLIVPRQTPPLKRQPNENASPENSFLYPAMWQNNAGIGQFPEAEQLLLKAANDLIRDKPEAFIPYNEFQGAHDGPIGSIGLLNIDYSNATIGDAYHDYFDLSTANQEDFDDVWHLVEYTLRFSRGGFSTEPERDAFRREGKLVWTTSQPRNATVRPDEGNITAPTHLPLTQDDLRYKVSNMIIHIETKDLLFAAMVNSMFTVVSENEPTNHFHSVFTRKEFINPTFACTEDGGRSKVCGEKGDDRSKVTATNEINHNHDGDDDDDDDGEDSKGENKDEDDGQDKKDNDDDDDIERDVGNEGGTDEDNDNDEDEDNAETIIQTRLRG